MANEKLRKFIEKKGIQVKEKSEQKEKINKNDLEDRLLAIENRLDKLENKSVKK